VKAIFCIGSSHITALREGHYARAQLRKAGGYNAWKEIGTLPHFKAGKYVISDALDDELVKNLSEAEVSAIFLCCGGGEHAELALFNVWPFDFYMPDNSRQEMSRNREIIPYDVMLATCASRIMSAIPFVQHIKNLSNLPMYHILPPPPPISEDHIKEYADPGFHELVEKHGITPAPLRHKVWQLCIIAARQIYKDMGISVIEPPSEAMDDWGFLAPQYRAPDPVHANAEYGALIADRLVAIAASHESRK
jgi:hypothetical protein